MAPKKKKTQLSKPEIQMMADTIQTLTVMIFGLDSDVLDDMQDRLEHESSVNMALGPAFNPMGFDNEHERKKAMLAKIKALKDFKKAQMELEGVHIKSQQKADLPPALKQALGLG